MLGAALAAADDLASRGVSAGVLNLQTLKPLDEAAILDAARRPGRSSLPRSTPSSAGSAAPWPACSASAVRCTVVRFGIMDTYAETGQAGAVV